DASLRPRVLITVAQCAGKLRDPEQGHAVLARVISAADTGRGEAELAVLFLAVAEAAAQLRDPNQAQALLIMAMQQTAGISAEPAKVHAEVALAETALRLGNRAQAKALMDAVIAARQRLGVNAVSDADLVRAVVVTAALGEWGRVASVAGMLDS